MKRVPGSLSEEQARSVLERATQLEVERGVDIDVHELRKAASDAGIPLPAFERALAEVLGIPEPSGTTSHATPTAAITTPPGPDDWISRIGLRGWARKAFLGAIGTAISSFGFIVGYRGTDELIPLTIFWAFLIVCGLIAARRRDRSVLGFETDLLALCAGLTLGWTLGNPVDTASIVVAMSFVGTAFALVGGVLVKLLGHTAPPPIEQPARVLLIEADETRTV